MAPILSKIPTFIINLERRCDRRIRVLSEFRGRNEFKVTIIKAIEHPSGAYGLSQTFLKIIKSALDSNKEFILICEDDHIFTSGYNQPILYKLINHSNSLEADVLVGGPSWFDYAIRADDDLLWLNAFTGAQFLIIFKRFYKKLCDYTFSEHEHLDLTISNISDRIFSASPLISIQKDFGYSDVNSSNNRLGVISKLYDGMINRLALLNKIYSLCSILKKIELQTEDYESLQITTYVINCSNQTDQLVHVREQFAGKSEFELSIVEACQNERATLTLWNSIKKIVKYAKDVSEDVIIICDNFHTFPEGYSSETLFRTIIHGAHLGADLILGGISDTLQAIVVSPDLCWIDTFQHTHFIIIYNSLFEQILDTNFDQKDTVNINVSKLTANKYVINPFISIPKNLSIQFDCIEGRPLPESFLICEEKLTKIQTISKGFNK